MIVYLAAMEKIRVIQVQEAERHAPRFYAVKRRHAREQRLRTKLLKQQIERELKKCTAAFKRALEQVDAHRNEYIDGQKRKKEN